MRGRTIGLAVVFISLLGAAFVPPVLAHRAHALRDRALKTVPNARRPVGGWIPVTRVVEADGGGGTAAAAPLQALANGNGANLYPRKAQPNDPTFVYPLFPKDALYTFLKLDTENLVGPVVNDEARADWVLDTLPNTDPPSVVGGIAYGINAKPNLSDNDPTNDLQTGTYDPTSNPPITRGHWPGLRIVDGVANMDQTVFGAGGKENDTRTWKVVPGSVGSAKDDITEAYLAESVYRTDDLTNYPDGLKAALMFGIERRANNGTTAYDLEINQLPATNNLIPNRSVGDLLISISLSSQATTPPVSFIFVWNGLKYVLFDVTTLPAAKRPVVTTNLVQTPSAPWGFVNAKGVWQVGQIPPACFTEMLIPISPELSLLNSATLGDTSKPLFMQIRTRSSVSDTADLKDLTTYFILESAGPTATLKLRSTCSQSLTYFPQWTVGDGSGIPYRWQFGCDTGSSLASSDPGFGPDPDAPGDSTRFAANFTDANLRTVQAVLPAGVPYVDIDVYLTTSPGTPIEDMLFDVIRVYRALAITPTLSRSASSVHAFDYAANRVGGKAPYTFVWTFYDSSNTVIGGSTTENGTFDAKKSGTYHATLTVTDTGDLDKDVCTVTTSSNSITFGHQ